MFKLTKIWVVTFLSKSRSLMSVRCFFSIAFISALSAESKSQDSFPRLVRSATITPGYMERTFNSNDMMKLGPLSLMQASSKAFDGMASWADSPWVKTGIYAAYMFPNYLLSRVSSTVFHEFGHARAFYSAGLNYHYDASENDGLITDYAYGIYKEKFLTPWALFYGAHTAPAGFLKAKKMPGAFVNRLITADLIKSISARLNKWCLNLEEYNNADDLSVTEKYAVATLRLEEIQSRNYHNNGASYTSEEEVNSVKKRLMKDDVSGAISILIENEMGLYVDVAGLNNEMRMAQEVSNLIWENQGHQMYASSYFIGKYSAFGYVGWLNSQIEEGKVEGGNDVANILRGYNNRGFSIDKEDLQIGSITSLLLSATTWSFVYSAITEIPKGSFVVHAPVWKGWRLPDLNFYLNNPRPII